MLRVQQGHGQGRPSSSESAAEQDAAAREDLAKLQRNYRVTEKARKSEGDKAQYVLRKQNDMIRALQTENEDLKKNLGLASSRQNELRGQHLHKRFDALITQQTQYKATISEEEKETAGLEEKIRVSEREMDRQRAEMGGTFASQEQHVAIQKQARVMENRLDKALVRFNSGLSRNGHLRSEIDHLRQQKCVFEGLHGRMQKDLLDVKRSMGEVIEDSTRAYDTRDDAQVKMLALKEKADKELAQHSMEIKELQRVIDYDRKLRDFMSRKNQERAEAHMQMEARKQQKEAEKANCREETVMNYEEAFEKIKEATSITDIDQLVTKFIEVEDQNFALFNFVNELNAEIEIVQDQIHQVQEEIRKFKSQGMEMEEKRKEILRGLEAELCEVTGLSGDYDKRFSNATKVLEQLMSGIDSVFNKIGCDATAITDLLGGHAGVTGTTVLQYLGIVEQKTNELMQIQAFLKAKESGEEIKDAAAKFLMSYPGQGSKDTSLELPSTMEDYESEGSDYGDTPLSQDELKAKALREINRREAAKKQAASLSPHSSPTHPPPSTAMSGKGGRVSVSDKKKRPVQTR